MLDDTLIKYLQRKVTTTKSEREVCSMFRVLGDWNRFRIIVILIEAKELCVGDIAKAVNISMSATSQHLRILELSGLVVSERMGQTICYMPSTEHEAVQAVLNFIKR
jgi:ArsR family transcriptional regulator